MGARGGTPPPRRHSAYAVDETVPDLVPSSSDPLEDGTAAQEFDEDQAYAMVAAETDDDRIIEIKAWTRCRACGTLGHWHRDPECPKYKQKRQKREAWRLEAGLHDPRPGRR